MEQDEAELNSILEEAMRLRRSSDAVLKRYFESLPGCVQRTLFEEGDKARERSINEAKQLEQEGDDLAKRNRTVDALVEFEKAVGCVFFVTLKPHAPHWRDRGVQDDWIKINQLDNELAAELLAKTGDCLLKLNQWPEASLNCNWAIKLNSKCTRAFLTRAKCKLKLNRPDSEETALRDLVKVTELDPEDTTAKTMISDLRSAMTIKRKKEKAVFGGIFNKPNVRLAVDDDHQDGNEVRERKPACTKVDLDPLELEAAKFAGLDVNSPEIRDLLIRLSTPEGQQLFEREQERLRKLQKRDSARLWLCMAVFVGILIVIGLQSWLKSMTINQPMESLGSIHRVQQAIEQHRQQQQQRKRVGGNEDDGSVRVIL